MKARLRADLLAAMKSKLMVDAKVLRALVAALDNAEAPPVSTRRAASLQHQFHSGSAEVERLLLSPSDVRQVISKEIDDRERAAVEMQNRNMLERAENLRKEANVIKRYV